MIKHDIISWISMVKHDGWNMINFYETWCNIMNQYDKTWWTLLKPDWFVLLTVEQPQTRKVGSISDYDPLNEKYGSIAGQHTDPRRGIPTSSLIWTIITNDKKVG